MIPKPQRSAILTYHSLDTTGSVISIPPNDFRRQMEALAASSTKVVPLSEIFDNPGAVAITFDDAFISFAEHAVPVLERLSLPATVFVVSGYCGGLNNWPSQPSGTPQMPLMSWAMLRNLPVNISLGAHTVSHPDLTSLDISGIEREVLQSRDTIEQTTGLRVDSFAYPYGHVDARSADVVRQNFRVACGTRLRFMPCATDPAVLPRLDVYYLKSPMWFRNPFGPFTSTYIGFRGILRQTRQWASGH